MSRRLFSSWWRDPERRPIAVLILVFVLALPGVTRRIYASDEVQFFSYLRSLWFDRDVSFENEYRHFYEAGIVGGALFHETFLERTSATGLRLNFGTIGSGLLWSPFYGAADLGVRAAAASGARVPADGYAWPYVAAVCWGSAVYGLLALVGSWACARHVLRRAGYAGRAPVTLATWTVWVGTPLIFYMYVAPGMSHAPSAFGVTAFVLVWLHARQRWSVAGLAALGGLAALMTMVREQDAFFAIGPAIDLLWWAIATRRATWVAGLGAGAVTFSLVFLPQALSYLALNGRIGPSQVTSRKMNWWSPHAWDVLASPRHGLLTWTPLAALALAGLVVLVIQAFRRAPRSDAAPPHDIRRLTVSLLAMVAAQIYIVGAVESWTLAGAFGQRRFVSLTPLLVVGLAALVAAARHRAARGAVVLVVAIAVWWNVGLMVQFGAGLMDRQRLDLPRNAYNTFVTVPRLLPEIAWRYLFDRGSFYRQEPAADRAPR